MKLKPPIKNINVRMFSAVISAMVLLAVVTVAYAESSGPLTAIPGLGRLPNATLVRMHKKEGTWYTEQEAVFVKANALMDNFQDLIDAQAKRGWDVNDLQAALAEFNGQVSASREIHNQAGAIIYSTDGWTANGEVRDRQAAGQSLLDGRVSLRDANFRLTHGMTVLRKSFVRWRATRISGIPLPPTITPTP